MAETIEKCLEIAAKEINVFEKMKVNYLSLNRIILIPTLTSDGGVFVTDGVVVFLNKECNCESIIIKELIKKADKITTINDEKAIKSYNKTIVDLINDKNTGFNGHPSAIGMSVSSLVIEYAKKVLKRDIKNLVGYNRTNSIAFRFTEDDKGDDDFIDIAYAMPIRLKK
jgi:hypothetical protein